MRTRHFLVSTLIAASLLAGSGVTPALASSTAPVAATQFSQRSTAPSAAGISPGSNPDTSVPGPTDRTTQPIATDTRGGIGSAIVAALKKVPGLFNTVGKAVKKGYSAFRTVWYNNVPAWIRFLAGDLSAATIYDLIKSFF